MRAILPILRHPLVRSSGSALISLMPIWLRPAAHHPFLWAFVPVLITYSMAAIGGAYLERSASATGSDAVTSGSDFGDLLGLSVGAVVFTVGHLGIPLFVYFASIESEPDANKLPGCFVYLCTGAWFGTPIILLAISTGWLSLAAAAVHLALAPRRERHWVFVEYGSTSFALLLFVLNFGDQVFPWGLPVVVLQSLLLTVAVVWGRKLVLSEDRSVRANVANAKVTKSENIAGNVPANSSLPKKGKTPRRRKKRSRTHRRRNRP